MDERQTKIREGAGLEESRINTELIDFLNKWSSPVLIVIGLVGLGWFGWNYLERAKLAKQNDAFAAYEAAMAGGNPAPASLRNIAADYAGVGSVAEMALLRTADLYLRAAITRVEPGASVDPATGSPEDENDALDDEGVRKYLSQARDLSRRVADATREDPARVLLFVQAQMRLGAALEGLGSGAEARSAYESAAGAAEASGYERLAVVARERAANAERLGNGVAGLPSRDQLAALPGEEPVEEPGAELPMNFDELMNMPFMQEALENGSEGDPDQAPLLPGAPDPAADPAGGGDGAP